MATKIIHTKTFHCDDDHPIVWYTFDKDNKAMCHYCAAQFVYEPEDPVKKEKELLEMSMKESLRQKEERIEKEKKTHSEEMQDKIEPIDHDHVNRVLKGSG